MFAILYAILCQLVLPTDGLLAVPFQSVEGASETRKQAWRDWSERTSRETFPQRLLGSHYFRSLG